MSTEEWPPAGVDVESVAFYSDGDRIAATLHRPEGRAEPLPIVIFVVGWIALAAAPNDRPWMRGFLDAGYAVLTFDYGGFGESEGERGWVRPDWQLEDTRCAVTYAGTLQGIDPHRIALYGRGGTGGGNAVIAGAVDDRVRCVISHTPVADGPTWLRRMRREYEWRAMLDSVEANHVNRVLTGEDKMVDPRADLMITTPERATVSYKPDTDRKVGDEFHLATAEHLLRYRPVESAPRFGDRALLLAAVERDAVTPVDHAYLLFEAASGPKRLIVQQDVDHYASYSQNQKPLMAEMLGWLERYAVPRGAVAPEHRGAADVVFI